MISLSRFGWVPLILFATSVDGLADAPNVAGLIPSGGQRGTEVTVRAIDSQGARRGRGRRRRAESTPQPKANVGDWQMWADAPGIELMDSESDDSLKVRLAADVSPGTHWLRFYTAEGASGLRPFVVGTAGEVAETEPNDSLENAQRLAELPATINGVLEKAGEVDTFGVTLQAGQTLVAVLAAKQTLGSPMDGILQVVDAQGFVMEQNHDHQGLDSRVLFTAKKDGAYFVRAFAFPSDPGTGIAFAGAPSYLYRLTIATGPFIDRVAPLAVTAGQPAKLQPGGWNLPADAGEIEAPPLAAGIHPVFHDGWQSTAKILATPHPVVMETEPNSLAEPQAIAIPQTVSGAIGEPGDIDGWKFSAEAGKRLAFTLTATALGSSLDAVLRIHDATGKVLQEFDDAPLDGADVHVVFAAPQAGEFVAVVTDRFAHGGPGYGYALSIAEETPEAVLSVAADAFIVKADAPLEIPVTVERRAGFAAPISIAVSGLPEGVTANAVVSEPHGDSSKSVKLSLTSSRTEPWSGPIRIAGKSDGIAADMSAVSLSPLTGDRLPHLWLTALPKPMP
jgi:hypothetical protein